MYAPAMLVTALRAHRSEVCREAADTILELHSLVGELRSRITVLEAEVREHRAGQQTLAGLTGGDAWR